VLVPNSHLRFSDRRSTFPLAVMGTQSHCLNLVIALVAVFAAAPSQGEGRSLGVALTEVRSLEKLPNQLRRLLSSTTRGRDGIADRGGGFNVTDLVNHELPMRRFALAAVGLTCAVVAVEYGGIAHGFELTEYRLTGTRWEPIGRHIVFDEPKSINDLLTEGQQASHGRLKIVGTGVRPECSGTGLKPPLSR
jgi:hypothetical protein